MRNRDRKIGRTELCERVVHEHRRRNAIRVKIGKYFDAFSVAKSHDDPIDCLIHIRQEKRIKYVTFVIGKKEVFDLFLCGYASQRKEFFEQFGHMGRDTIYYQS